MLVYFKTDTVFIEKYRCQRHAGIMWEVLMFSGSDSEPENVPAFMGSMRVYLMG